MTTTSTVPTFGSGRAPARHATFSTGRAARRTRLTMPDSPRYELQSTVPQNLRNRATSGIAVNQPMTRMTGWEIFPPRATWGFAARVVPSIRRDRVTRGFITWARTTVPANRRDRRTALGAG